MIPLATPILSHEEKQALAAVIDSTWLTMGDQVRLFEEEFAALHHTEAAVAVSSCTAGLHLALLALGIQSGDEVLVPAMTFVATANAVLYTGATPVFVDIESIRRPHIDLEDATTKLSPRTKAVIVMHYAGYPVPLAAWREFADRHGLLLVEDAAHAPGVPPVGQIGDAAVFSFFSNKNMTTGEGGMVTARSPETLAKVRALRSHAMSSNTLVRHKGYALSYDITDLGFNYRMDELRAALGRCQLTRLLVWNAQRRALIRHYHQQLRILLPELVIPFREFSDDTAAHLFVVVLPEGIDRGNLMQALRADNIQTSIHYPAIHQFSYYQARFPDIHLPATEAFAAGVLTLPLSPSLGEDEIDYIVEALAADIQAAA